jgi:hypothetical protein
VSRCFEHRKFSCDGDGRSLFPAVPNLSLVHRRLDESDQTHSSEGRLDESCFCTASTLRRVHRHDVEYKRHWEQGKKEPWSHQSVTGGVALSLRTKTETEGGAEACGQVQTPGHHAARAFSFAFLSSTPSRWTRVPRRRSSPLESGRRKQSPHPFPQVSDPAASSSSFFRSQIFC